MEALNSKRASQTDLPLYLDLANLPRLAQFAAYSQPPPKIECFLYCALASADDSWIIIYKSLILLNIFEKIDRFTFSPIDGDAIVCGIESSDLRVNI